MKCWGGPDCARQHSLQNKSSVPEASGYPGAVPGESRGPGVAPGAAPGAWEVPLASLSEWLTDFTVIFASVSTVATRPESNLLLLSEISPSLYVIMNAGALLHMYLAAPGDACRPTVP